MFRFFEQHAEVTKAGTWAFLFENLWKVEKQKTSSNALNVTRMGFDGGMGDVTSVFTPFAVSEATSV
jgi:hypothetical protein